MSNPRTQVDENLDTIPMDTSEDDVLSDADLDLLAIEDLLSQENLIDANIQQLKRAYQQYCKERNCQFSITDKDRWPQFKVLSDLLLQWAKENNFSADTKFVKILQPALLNSFGSQHTFFNDNAGNNINWFTAWTHALIWYSVVEQNKKTPFLCQDPVVAYQQLCDAKMATASPLAWHLMLELITTPPLTIKDNMMSVGVGL